MEIFVVSYVFDENYTFNNIINEEIHSACQRQFETVRYHRFHQDKQADLDFMRGLFQRHREGRPFLLIDLNAAQNYTYNGEMFVTNRLMIGTDAPYTMAQRLRAYLPKGGAVTYSDRTHERILREFRVENPSFFLPHFGPTPPESVPSITARDIPVLFLGRVDKPEPEGDFTALFGADTDPVWHRLFKNAGERALTGGEEPYLAFRAACDDIGTNPGEDPMELAGILSKFYSWVEFQNRNRLLAALKDLEVHIVGPVFGDVPALRDARFVHHGPKTGPQAREFLRRARTMLNSVSVFPEGSHERIWFAAAEGAVCFTDRSRYLEEVFGSEQAMLFHSHDDAKVAQRLSDTLSDTNGLQSMSDRAREIYRTGHTPTHRVAEIVSRITEIGLLGAPPA